MVTILVNIELKIRILAETATLNILKQKFKRLVSLETTDKSAPHFHNDIPLSYNLMYKGFDRESRPHIIAILPGDV